MLHFIDVETTGLRPWEGQEIIEIAIITESPNGLVERYSTKVQPVRLEFAEAKALEINGYSASGWEGAPCMEEIAGEVYKILRRGIIVGHNVSFDSQFINIELERYGYGRISYVKVDTMTLAHEHLSPCGLWGLGLKAIRKYMGWSCDGAHTAMVDAEDCRRLYHSLIRRSWYNGVSGILGQSKRIVH